MDGKEISSKQFSFFIGIIQFQGSNFMLFAQYVRYMAKIKSHKFYQIVNIQSIPTEPVADKTVLKELDILVSVF